jgi:hypothetical protein
VPRLSVRSWRNMPAHPTVAGEPMVDGTQYMIDHQRGTAMFAHSEHPPTVLDFRNNTLHRCEVDQASFQNH